MKRTKTPKIHLFFFYIQKVKVLWSAMKTQKNGFAKTRKPAWFWWRRGGLNP